MPADAPPTRERATSPADAWLAARRGRVIGGLLAAALVIRLVVSLQIAGGPLPRTHEIVAESDNAFFHQWGQRIAAGDLVQRAPSFPRCGWMLSVAQRALEADPSLPGRLGIAVDPADGGEAVAWRLWEHWLGGATFFQEPLYPYLVGLTYSIAGPNVWAVFAWQLALGAAGVLLVWSLALRLGSESAAAAAGVLAVLAPIPLMYELTLLRDGLAAYTTLGLALAMAWAPGGRAWRWFALGALFGTAVLLKTTFWLFPALFGLWRLAAVRSPAKDRVKAAGLTAVGIVLALSPAMIRNALVGVPLLALNGSAPAMLATFHTADAPAVGWVASADWGRLLATGDGGMLQSLAGAARTHATALGFVLLNLKKLLFVWHGFEAENNVDFYLFRHASPLFASLPATFVLLLPLAFIGAVAARSRAAPVLVAVIGSIPTMIVVTVLSRYRAPLTASLLPLAGAGCVQLTRWVASRRWVPIASAAAAAALYLAWATRAPAGHEPDRRSSGYRAVAAWSMQQGEPAYASLALKESLRLAPGIPATQLELGLALMASGDLRAAVPYLDAASRGLRTPQPYEVLGTVLFDLGRFDDARAALRECLVLDPMRPVARVLLAQIEADADSGSTRRR